MFEAVMKPGTKMDDEERRTRLKDWGRRWVIELLEIKHKSAQPNAPSGCQSSTATSQHEVPARNEMSGRASSEFFYLLQGVEHSALTPDQMNATNDEFTDWEELFDEILQSILILQASNQDETREESASIRYFVLNTPQKDNLMTQERATKSAKFIVQFIKRIPPKLFASYFVGMTVDQRATEVHFHARICARIWVEFCHPSRQTQLCFNYS